MEYFDSSRAFESWFAKIIVHASSDFYRYTKPPNADIEKYSNKLFQEDETIIDKLSYDELLECITHLSPQYRTIFNMYIIDGYKHHEIAELLGISTGTSKSKVNFRNIIVDREASTVFLKEK